LDFSFQVEDDTFDGWPSMLGGASYGVKLWHLNGKPMWADAWLLDDPSLPLTTRVKR